MRGHRFWLCVPPAALCLAGAVPTFWRLAHPDLAYGLRWLIGFRSGDSADPLQRLLAWSLIDPFLALAVPILWIFAFGSLLLVLPERAAKVLSLGLVLAHAALLALALLEWANRSVALATVALAATALTVGCLRRARAPDPYTARLRRAAFALAALLLLDAVAVLAIHLFGRWRFAREVAATEALLGKRLSFDLARFERPVPPDQNNAARGFLAVGEALDLTPLERERLSLLHRMPSGYSWLERAESFRRMIESHHQDLELLHQASERSGSSFRVRYRSGSATQLPNTLELLYPGRLLSAESRVAFVHGDEAGGLRAARTLARLRDSLDGEPGMIFRLIGVVTSRWSNRLALEVAASPESWAASPPLLAGLAADLRSEDPALRVEETLELEALEEAGSARSSWRTGAWRLSGEPLFTSPVAAFAFGPLRGAQTLAGYRQAMTLIRSPLGTLLTLDPRRPSSSGRPGHWTLPPGLGVDLIAKVQVVTSQSQLARAALALRRLGLAAGRYPQRPPPLPELTQATPFTGKPIAYHVFADGSLRLEVEGADQLGQRLWRLPEAFRVTLPPPAAPARH